MSLSSCPAGLYWFKAHPVQCELSDPAGLRLTKCNVSPTHMHAHRLNLTQRSSAMLCLSMILYPSKGGPAKAGHHSASNLSFILIPYLAQMPDDPDKKPGIRQKIPIFTSLWVIKCYSTACLITGCNILLFQLFSARNPGCRRWRED